MRQNAPARISSVSAVLVIPGLAISSCAAVEPGISSDEQASEAQQAESPVVRVIDGDTITVEPTAQLEQIMPVGEQENDPQNERSIRLLGIDAPEMNYRSAEDIECGAQEATDFAEDLLAEGEPVRVVFDEDADTVDVYGRGLAYIEVADGIDVGLALVEAGHAEAWYPDSAPEPSRFQKYEQATTAAQQDEEGLWGACPPESEAGQQDGGEDGTDD